MEFHITGSQPTVREGLGEGSRMHKHPRLRDFGQLGYRCVSQWSSGRRGRLSWERVGGQTDYRVLSRSWGRVWEVQLEFTDGLNTVAT